MLDEHEPPVGPAPTGRGDETGPVDGPRPDVGETDDVDAPDAENSQVQADDEEARLAAPAVASADSDAASSDTAAEAAPGEGAAPADGDQTVEAPVPVTVATRRRRASRPAGPPPAATEQDDEAAAPAGDGGPTAEPAGDATQPPAARRRTPRRRTPKTAAAAAVAAPGEPAEPSVDAPAAPAASVEQAAGIRPAPDETPSAVGVPAVETSSADPAPTGEVPPSRAARRGRGRRAAAQAGAIDTGSAGTAPDDASAANQGSAASDTGSSTGPAATTDPDVAESVARDLPPDAATADGGTGADGATDSDGATTKPRSRRRRSAVEAVFTPPVADDVLVSGPVPEEPGPVAPPAAPGIQAVVAPIFVAPEPVTVPRRARRPAGAPDRSDPAAGPDPAAGSDSAAGPEAPAAASQARPEDHEAEVAPEEGTSAAAKRRRRRRRGRGGGADEAAETGSDGQPSAADGAGRGTESGVVVPTGGVTTEPAEEADDGEAESDDQQASGGSRRRRRRRRRSGGGSDQAAGTPNVPDEGVPTVVHVRAGSTRAGRRNDSDSRSDSRPDSRPDNRSDNRPDDDGVTAIRGSTRLEAKRQRRRDSRDSTRRRAPVVSEAEFLARRELVERVMLVREGPDRTQIAVLEDGVLVEHYVAQAGSSSQVGNVYLGRVQNVLASMEAAFVDFGRGRNGVLYAGEVNYDASGLEGKPRRIEQALKSGQSVLVQVTKDPIGHKGARLTSQVSLPGRFVVYVPGGERTGISRKLPDTERARLKSVLREVSPEDAGMIVRTAAEGASEEELGRDVRRLHAQWEEIQKKATKASAPAALYAEPDLVVRVVRDLFNEDFAAMLVQAGDEWDTIESYVDFVAPDLADRVSRWRSPEDLFAAHRVDEQLAKALDRKVWLPSGGYLVIDRTEAMTVVDVNTGKYTGSGGNLEETVTRNNLEAAEEIVRQIRLRDVGGIIVVDFIDMVLESNRDLVLRRLVECLGRDRTKHQVAEVTSLGLVQMTRKRVGAGLLEAFTEPCPECHGLGTRQVVDPFAVPPRTDLAADEPAPGPGAEPAAAAELDGRVATEPDGQAPAAAGPDGGAGAEPGPDREPAAGPTPDGQATAGAEPDGHAPDVAPEPAAVVG